MRVLIVGCGYVGLALAGQLAGQGHTVSGLCRGRRSENELRALGVGLLLADITQPESLARLPSEYDWVVNCVSSSGGDEPDYRNVYLHGARNLAAWLRPHPPRAFVYTSSTSVYAQDDGTLVTEASPAEPAAPTSKILVETERVLLAAAAAGQLPAVILRVAGIYGPGRGYWFKQFLNGEATMEGRGGRVLNMIHRDDVAGAIIAALERGTAGNIYNAVDDEPVSQRDFFQWLAETLKRPMPPSGPEEPAAPRRRGATHKRVSNARLKVALGYRLKYPTFREGYLAEIRRLAG
jgi:nucleoside-diphosphate-sugar epimerase